VLGPKIELTPFSRVDPIFFGGGMKKSSLSPFKMSLIGHMEELRRKLIICILTVLACSIFSYFYSDKILTILKRPFIAPQEPFIITLKIALFGGIIFALPMITYQVWQFISSGLKKKEKRHLLFYSPFSLLLFLSGASFAYFLVVPVGLRFLLSFGGSSLQPMISISKYLSFITLMILAFGIVFELPLVFLFLARMGIVTPQFLAKKRKVFIIAIFVLAAILTPPDVFTQILLAAPLLILYEVSIWLTKRVVH
jgi:sec-independent protein translocase protein TatC